MRKLMAALAVCAGLAPTVAAAAPATDDKTLSARMRWVAGGGARCDTVCGARGAVAENMLVYSSDGGDIYLCRVRKPPSNRFGTNYEDICKVEDSDAPSGAASEAIYDCLCVWPAE